MADLTSDNILQQVITYQSGGLAFLQNQNCFIGTANTKFKNFDKLTANLGDTVSFDLPLRSTAVNSLVWSTEPIAQRTKQLTVDYPLSISQAYDAQQFIFNLHDYMDNIGKSNIIELGSQIESWMAELCVTDTYRFYGDGTTPINSSGQLAKALAQFRNYGAVNSMAKGYLSDVAVPDIINTNANQFAPDRANRELMSWELGPFSNCEWYQSNLLPVHVAGSEGEAGVELTVYSVTKNSLDQITAITFSGTSAASDSNSIKEFDKMYFIDGVSGKPNLRYLTWTGYKPSANPVQFRATADAGSTGASRVTVNIYPFLQASAGKDQNITSEVQVGMKVKVLPSHRAGMITAGNPMFLAMPKLPAQVPFPTSNAIDPDTGVSLRMTYGSQLGLNTQVLGYDVIAGKAQVNEYTMALIFPL